jgi:hypothetical protein
MSSSVVFWQAESALRLCDFDHDFEPVDWLHGEMSSVLAAEDFLDVVCVKMAMIPRRHPLKGEAQCAWMNTSLAICANLAIDSVLSRASGQLAITSAPRLCC